MSDEEDEQQNQNSFDDEKDQTNCNCTQECANHSCTCFKDGSGCNSSCGCQSSCQNLFNHLDYFFGENNKSPAHPCFAKWLIKKVKTVDELKMIDRDKLRRHILKSAK